MIVITVVIVMFAIAGQCLQLLNQIGFLLTCQSQAEAVIVVVYEVLQRGETIARGRPFSAFMNPRRFLEASLLAYPSLWDSLKVTTISVDAT